MLGGQEHFYEAYSQYDEVKSATRPTKQFARSFPAQTALLTGRESDTNAKVGAHGARETPVPIPNTEVKPRSGYYTAFAGK